MSLKFAAALSVGVLVLGACGGEADKPGGSSSKTAASPLFPDAFKGVCSGAGVGEATAYDAKASSHKALYFQSYRDALQDQSTGLPPAWTVTFSPEGNALAAIDIVVCAQRSADKLVKTCDGYKDDDKATGNKVRWHSATYDVTVHEATTAKQLLKREIEATDETCPMIASFDGKNQTIDMYDTLDDTVIANLLRPFMEK
jgi:hypothetical protein